MTDARRDVFTDEQVQAMIDKPVGVARRILGPEASEAAVQASARMVSVLGTAFSIANREPGRRVAIETIGEMTGAVRVVQVEEEDSDVAPAPSE